MRREEDGEVGLADMGLQSKLLSYFLSVCPIPDETDGQWDRRTELSAADCDLSEYFLYFLVPVVFIPTNYLRTCSFEPQTITLATRLSLSSCTHAVSRLSFLVIALFFADTQSLRALRCVVA